MEIEIEIEVKIEIETLHVGGDSRTTPERPNVFFPSSFGWFLVVVFRKQENVRMQNWAENRMVCLWNFGGFF